MDLFNLMKLAHIIGYSIVLLGCIGDIKGKKSSLSFLTLGGLGVQLISGLLLVVLKDGDLSLEKVMTKLGILVVMIGLWIAVKVRPVMMVHISKIFAALLIAELLIATLWK